MSASESETLSDAFHALREFRAFFRAAKPDYALPANIQGALALTDKVLGQPRPPVRRKTLRRP